MIYRFFRELRQRGMVPRFLGGTLSLVCLLLISCQPQVPAEELPQDLGYMLAGRNSGRGFARNALLVFDGASWQAHAKTNLPASRARYLQREPAGNLWIGLSGTFDRGDDRVLVFSPQGELLHTLHLCLDPEGGISFAAGHAFVACAEDGFDARVIVVDLAQLEIVKEISLRVEGAPFVVLGSAASEDAVVISGLTAGENPDATYSALAIIDPQMLTLTKQVNLGPNTDVWTILPWEKRFLLLNSASDQQPDAAPRQDVLILDPRAPDALESLTLPQAAPLWGIVHENQLYSYHNPTWNSTTTSTARWVSRVDLTQLDSDYWSLPEDFEAGDIAVLHGRPCLAHWAYWEPDAEHGLYCLEEDDTWTLKLALPDASGVIF